MQRRSSVNLHPTLHTHQQQHQHQQQTQTRHGTRHNYGSSIHLKSNLNLPSTAYDIPFGSLSSRKSFSHSFLTGSGQNHTNENVANKPVSPQIPSFTTPRPISQQQVSTTPSSSIVPRPLDFSETLGNMYNQTSAEAAKYKSAPVQLAAWIHQAHVVEDPVQVLMSRLPSNAKEGDIMEVRRMKNGGNGETKLGRKVYFVVKPLSETKTDISSQAQVCFYYWFIFNDSTMFNKNLINK